MPIPATQFIWFNGKLVPWEKATVHVLSHALHYGSSVFEGVRAYETPKGVAIFRLRDHTRRLFDSAKIYRIAMPFSAEQLNEACREVIAANGLKRGAYIRPVVFRGYGEIGVTPEDRAADRGRGGRLGMGQVPRARDAEEHGVDVCVSSWQRVAPNTLPALAKAGGNYLSSQLIGAGGAPLGVRRRHRSFLRRHLERGLGRESLPGEGRGAAHAGAGALGARRPHARYGHAARARARHRGDASARCRASCSTSPTRRSSPARRSRSPPSARSTGCPWARASAVRSPRRCSRPSSACSPARPPTSGAGSTTSTWPRRASRPPR